MTLPHVVRNLLGGFAEEFQVAENCINGQLIGEELLLILT